MQSFGKVDDFMGMITLTITILTQVRQPCFRIDISLYESFLRLEVYVYISMPMVFLDYNEMEIFYVMCLKRQNISQEFSTLI